MSVQIIDEDVQIRQIVLADDVTCCLCVGLDKEFYVLFEEFSQQLHVGWRKTSNKGRNEVIYA